MLCNFPSCIKGWLDVRELNNEDVQVDDLKSSGILSVPNWRPQFCILMENDSKLYIFGDEPTLEEFPIPDHIGQCRLDLELNSHLMSDSCSCIDDVSTISSKTHDSDKYNSNASLTHMDNGNKQYVKSGIFRNGSRLFRRAKSNNKLNSSLPSGKDVNFENNPPTKSVSTLKRSLSLSRLNRKKSEEKSDSKSPRSTMKNNQYMTQSTGDLTMNVSSICAARHNLKKDSIIADVHTSLVGERPHCFSVYSLAVDINSDSDFNGKTKDLVLTKRIFAAKSLLEKQCWMKRLQQTLKPNLENENRLNNLLKLTIFESKFLPIQKRRYFCEIFLDKCLYAKTTSKLSSSEGCVFWAEDLVLNNLPNFKNLSLHLYKEPDPGKDSKKKKRKNLNQCLGTVTFTISSLACKDEFQSWFTIKSLDLLPDLNTSNAIQLRVKLRYQSLKVLRCDSYKNLAKIVTNNYLELIQFLDKNLPVKLREEIASCLVNIHEHNGTITEFLTDLISEEVNDLDNSSMTLRANTIVTKIIESHMKLVGSEYLHNMLHSFIRDVMYKNVTIEVDASRMNFSNENQDKVILDNQHRLIEYLKQIWYKIYDSKSRNFPKQLKLVFTGWRQILESTTKIEEEREKISAHCDVIVSGCIFLRLLCPAILSPHLFGLVSHFSEKTYVQRTLTLIAKSLQSLANFSQFGDKEHFMIFLNKCFEEEIPRMHDFLRFISSVPCDDLESFEELQTSVRREVNFYGSTIDISVELARLHNCLASESMKELLIKSPKVQNIIRLPDIIRDINQQLQSFTLQSSGSFFTKKTQVSNTSTSDQRRASLGPLVNTRIQELGRSDKDNSPPRLGSPICQSTSVVDPVSEYGLHNNDVWEMRADAKCNNNVKIPKNPAFTPIIYSMKPQYTIAPIPKHQMNIPTIHKGHYNTRETDESQIIEESYKKVPDQKISPTNNNSQHNQPKSSIPKSVQPQSKRIPTAYFQPSPKNPSHKPHDEVHYSKVNDYVEIESLKRKLRPTPSCEQPVEIDIREYYQENPLYDFVEKSTISTPEFDKSSLNTIDRYFSVRSHVSQLEQQLKQTNPDSTKSQNLKELYQEMESIRLEVQNEQMKDLKQLKQLVNFNKGGVGNRMYSSLKNSQESNQHQKDVSNLVMTETLDEVINAITIDGAGLEEAQMNLRRQHLKKEKFLGKVQSPATNRPRQHSLGAILNVNNNNNNDNSIQIVPIEFSESQPDSSQLPPAPVKSHSSSNCSSLTPWLI